MASISLRTRSDREGHNRYEVRWREWDHKGELRQRSKSFRHKKAAAKFHGRKLAELGGYLEPSTDGKSMTLAEWYEDLHESWHNLAASTIATRESVWRTHLLPAFGRRRLDRITKDAVRDWQRTMRQAGQLQQAGRALSMLSQAMKEAQGRGLLRHNPCDGVKPPKVEVAPPTDLADLSAEQVMALANAAAVGHAQGRLVALMAALAGLRFSEIAGLRVRDFDGSTVRIERVTVEVAGRQYDKPPKTAASRRPSSSPIPSLRS